MSKPLPSKTVKAKPAAKPAAKSAPVKPVAKKDTVKPVAQPAPTKAAQPQAEMAQLIDPIAAQAGDLAPNLSNLHLTAHYARALLTPLINLTGENTMPSHVSPGQTIKSSALVLWSAIEKVPDDELIFNLYARHIWRETCAQVGS